jgi:hypothetical protein
MSKAGPLLTDERVEAYRRQRGVAVWSDHDGVPDGLTARQRRRVRHKATRLTGAGDRLGGPRRSVLRPPRMTAVIYRYEIPVDDRWHDLPLRGPIIHVASRQPDVVEVWALHNASAPLRANRFIVIGTGHPFPADGGYLATALAPHGLVWHLLAVDPYLAIDRRAAPPTATVTREATDP